MVFSAELPTIDARTSGRNSPPSSAYSAASEISHSFSESTRVPSISHSTACMTAIVSRRGGVSHIGLLSAGSINLGS